MIDAINSNANKYLIKIDNNSEESNGFIDSIKFNTLLEAVRSDINKEILKLSPKNFRDTSIQAKCIEKYVGAQEVMVNNNFAQNFEINSITLSKLEVNKYNQELSEKL